MDSEHKYRAEDFLSGNIPKSKEHLISENERELSADIKGALKSAGNERLSALEIEGLWDKIESANKSRPARYNKQLYFKIAASLLLVMSMAIWQYQKNIPTNKLLDFAAQNLNKTTLNNHYPDKSILPDQVVSQIADDAESIITTNDFNTVIVGGGKRSSISLPDGTKVWLSSASKLIYPVAFTGESREVYLEGDAYFDVFHQPKMPFYVRSKNMEIKVLGTEFYVSSHKDSTQDYAVLVEGSIAFSAGSWLKKTELLLKPGDKVNLNAQQKVVVSKVETQEFEVWRNGYMDISSETLDVIIQRLAKYYNITIRTDGLDLSKDRFSGRLDFQRSADDVLNMLCSGTPYVYNREEGRMELKKN